MTHKTMISLLIPHTLEYHYGNVLRSRCFTNKAFTVKIPPWYTNLGKENMGKDTRERERESLTYPFVYERDTGEKKCQGK